MKVVIAIDSFKGSLTSLEAGNTVSEAIREVFPDADIVTLPLADGGEGTLEAIIASGDGRIISARVTGPLGEPLDAEYGITKDGVAVIEMSRAAGLTLVPEEKRNPLYTTTVGVGELIRHAITGGCRSFIIGIGGSATNDGGVGMLSALGYRFLDGEGNEISPTASGLQSLKQIDKSKVLPELSECHFSVACDVKNPLLGEFGCSRIFAPQKGADEAAISKMELWLENFADITANLFKKDKRLAEGAGAAGGLGFALISYLGAELKSGIELIIRASGIEEKMVGADFVITGEGRMDLQSAMGKAPVGIAAPAKRNGARVIAFCGALGAGAEDLYSLGIDAIFPITPPWMPLNEAMRPCVARANLSRTAIQVFEDIRAKIL